MANIFDGVPWDHTASVGFDADPTITYFFRMNPTTLLNEVFIHDELSNTTTVSDIGIPTMFPDLPVDKPIIRGSENQPYNIGEHLIYWIDNALSPPLQFIVTTSPSAVPVYIGSANLNYIYHAGASVEQVSTGTQWSVTFGWNHFYAARGSISHLLPTGQYGGVGQPYAGLPYTGGGAQVETEYCSILRVTGQDNQVYLFRPNGDAIILDLLAQQISSVVPYGPISSAPIVPPTPLPDIVIPYSAPSQFNLFATDVALVSETQYGWNFTKTINDSNKLHLYLYHSSAPGAIPFNYNDLLQITVNMKNNLVLPAGEIFMNVYTGPPVAPNWYNYKDTYNFSPALGTTLDIELIEHILNLTDARSDPILAISLHSNSAQQQINCDVDKVSFNIILSSTSNPQNSQKVIVDLQHNFIVLDDKYFDLAQTAQGWTANILGGWSQSNFTPNIYAGIYPSGNGTFQDQASGTAWTLGQVTNEFQRWFTVDNVGWNPEVGSIAMFINNPASTNPGIDVGGIAYIGCSGIFNVNPAWLVDPPIAWEITDTNLLKISYTTRAPDFMDTLENRFGSAFSPLQKQTGMYTTQTTGISTQVWIGVDVPNTPNLVFPREGTFRCLSDTQIMLRLGWQHNETTYTLNPSDGTEMVGQYIDPAFTTSYAPTSYKMPTDWVKIPVIPPEEFILTFSEGLSDTIDTDGAYSVSVTPPSTTGVTYSYTANYYTDADVLISPVVGFGATGITSSFTISYSTNVPSNAAYISYVCTSSETVIAQLSLVIIQPVSVPFILTFQAPNNQILSDAIYSVFPIVANPLHSYVYTATFRSISSASLGSVPGAGLSGQSSSFNITYANLPATVAYIDYTCTDGTESSQLSITIVPICPPCPPAPEPGDIYGTIVSESAANIIQLNNSVDASHKRIDVKKLDNITLELTDIDGNVKYCSSNIYYELEFKINKTDSFN